MCCARKGKCPNGVDVRDRRIHWDVDLPCRKIFALSVKYVESVHFCLQVSTGCGKYGCICPRGLLGGRGDWRDKVALKKVFKPELDDARVYACGSDLPERVGEIPQPSGGICELGMVKRIVKLRPELEDMTFFYRGVLDNRDIPVKLAGTASNTYAGIAPSGAIAIDAAGWQCTECSLVEVTGATAYSAQPIMNVAGRWD